MRDTLSLFLLWFCRPAVGFVFAYSLVAKLRAVSDFHRSLTQFGIPASATIPVALAILVVEATVALAMVLGGVMLRAGFGTATVLVTGFSIATSAAIGRRTSARCYCFGWQALPVSATHLVRNLALISICGLGFILVSTSGSTHTAVPWSVSAVASLSALFVTALLTSLPEISDVLHRWWSGDLDRAGVHSS